MFLLTLYSKTIELIFLKLYSNCGNYLLFKRDWYRTFLLWSRGGHFPLHSRGLWQQILEQVVDPPTCIENNSLFFFSRIKIHQVIKWFKL